MAAAMLGSQAASFALTIFDPEGHGGLGEARQGRGRLGRAVREVAMRRRLRARRPHRHFELRRGDSGKTGMIPRISLRYLISPSCSISSSASCATPVLGSKVVPFRVVP
jgi:hypothetical protein